MFSERCIRERSELECGIFLITFPVGLLFLNSVPAGNPLPSILETLCRPVGVLNEFILQPMPYFDVDIFDSKMRLSFSKR